MAQLTEFPIETTPLAEVNEDTEADSILIVNGGVVKQVALNTGTNLLAALTYTTVATW